MGEEGTEGTVHLLCLAASSGVPLFCRSSRRGTPARQQLPFSVIGSLNGVHMFGQNLEVQLSSARTKDTTVVWKSFHDSITLIVLSSEEDSLELKLERLLQMVFGAMVLLVGLEELTNIRNVERLKKELKASYCLIDSFLGDSELIGDLTQCVDCVIPPEGSLFQVLEMSLGPFKPVPMALSQTSSSYPWTIASTSFHSLSFHTWPQKDLYTHRADPSPPWSQTSHGGFYHPQDKVPAPHSDASGVPQIPTTSQLPYFGTCCSFCPLNTALVDSPGMAASQQYDSRQVT